MVEEMGGGIPLPSISILLAESRWSTGGNWSDWMGDGN